MDYDEIVRQIEAIPETPIPPPPPGLPVPLPTAEFANNRIYVTRHDPIDPDQFEVSIEDGPPYVVGSSHHAAIIVLSEMRFLSELDQRRALMRTSEQAITRAGLHVHLVEVGLASKNQDPFERLCRALS